MRRSRSPRACPNSRPKKSTFSNTDSVGYRFLPRPCGMYAMRGRRALRCPASPMSPPSTSMRPDWIARAPAISAKTLDLPTPSGPMKPAMHPAGTSRLTASSARVLP